MSEWNKISGNWSTEERDFSKWGEGRIKELLQDEAYCKENGIEGTLKVNKVDGDVCF